MQLVLTYTIDGGYECCGYDQIHPIEYDSAEALICDFEAALDASIAKAVKEQTMYWEEFKIGKETFFVDNFYIGSEAPRIVGSREKILPEIYTLEEWFQKFRIL